MQIPRFRSCGIKRFTSRGPRAARPYGWIATLLLALPSLAAPQETLDQGIIQAEPRVVLVNVVVKDKHGKPVEDLRRHDFVLLDNNPEKQAVRRSTISTT